jgi:hypothetical protein
MLVCVSETGFCMCSQGERLPACAFAGRQDVAGRLPAAHYSLTEKTISVSTRSSFRSCDQFRGLAWIIGRRPPRLARPSAEFSIHSSATALATRDGPAQIQRAGGFQHRLRGFCLISVFPSSTCGGIAFQGEPMEGVFYDRAAALLQP